MTGFSMTRIERKYGCRRGACFSNPPSRLRKASGVLDYQSWALIVWHRVRCLTVKEVEDPRLRRPKSGGETTEKHTVTSLKPISFAADPVVTTSPAAASQRHQ